jgi:hypothetical protein
MDPLFQTAGKIAGKFIRGGVTIYTAPNDIMLPPGSNRDRIPDIYWKQVGWGWINELKVGRATYTSRNTIEALGDAYMLDYNMAFGNGKNNKNQILPINLDIWWFAPDRKGAHGPTDSFMSDLLEFGINVIELAFVPGAPPFPRNQGKQEKEKEVKQIGSGKVGEVEAGLNEMFPPLLACIP